MRNDPSLTACTACATAKRRCGRQRPTCARCQKQSLKCHYRPPPRSNFVALIDAAAGSLSDESLADPRTQLTKSRTRYKIPNSLGFDCRLIQNVMQELPEQADDGTRLSSWWFAAPETWVIERPCESTRSHFSRADLEHILSVTNRWLSNWLEKGANPFIHRQLYKDRFPRCMQDAYTALSAYVTRSKSNEAMVFRIIEDRASGLVEEDFINPLTQDVTLSAGVPLHERLARVQSLLIYQIICLYDGDLRLRLLAERHIPVLSEWMTQLVDHSSRVLCDGSFADSGWRLSQAPMCKHALWSSWIYMESVRRTCLVVSGMQGIYLALQGRADACLGGMMVTMRKGFWDAPTALAWEKQCAEVYGGFTSVTQADHLFDSMPPDQVDDFARLLLEICFGEEKLEHWGVPIKSD